jgi:hypothetical protein
MMRVAFGGRGQVGNSADAGRRQFGKTRPRGRRVGREVCWPAVTSCQDLRFINGAAR